jgi:NADH:ubiquinone oxidoreductase subunit 6 (subunit J)
MVKPQLSTNFLLLSWTCSDTSIGYNPVSVLNTVDAGSYSNIRADTAEGLTRVFILHPVSTVLLAIAFLLSLLNKSTIISILAAVTAGIGFIVAAVAAIIDFVAFGLLLTEINDAEAEGKGKYGSAAYLAVIAAALALVGTLILFITCCAGRRKQKRAHRTSRNKAMHY